MNRTPALIATALAFTLGTAVGSTPGAAAPSPKCKTVATASTVVENVAQPAGFPLGSVTVTTTVKSCRGRIVTSTSETFTLPDEPHPGGSSPAAGW